jgi:peptidoglycan hydrolase-like amidase
VRLRRREALGLLVAQAASAPAWAGGAPVEVDPLVRELYAHRLAFDGRGRPLIAIGLMQGQKRVVVRAKGGFVVTVGEQHVEVAADKPVVIERLQGTPAQLRELAVVDTLEGSDRRLRAAVVEGWKKRGLPVRAYECGGVYGVKGTVVDNRAVLVAHDGPMPRGFDDVRPVPVEWLDALPTAVVKVSSPTSSITGGAVRLRARDGGPVLVERVERGIGYAEHGFEDRLLRDEIAIVPDKQGLLAVVNIVDEDAMVAGVLPSEMFVTAPMEALKAQAVTARGELFAKIGRRHFADPFLVCSEQHCQVYKGRSAEHPRTTEAALQTSGELAFLDGRLVDSVYSACCGGHSESAEVVWDKPPRKELIARPDAPRSPKAHPWLATDAGAAFFAAGLAHVPLIPPGVGTVAGADSDAGVRALLEAPREAAWCGRSTFNQKGTAWRWERRFTLDELTGLCADLGVGRVRRLVVEGRGPGGRLRALRVDGDAGSARVLRELPVRRRFGNLRSGLFVIDEERGEDGVVVAVVFRGAGFGHGAGMCQQGAIGMAEAGARYTDILAHSYNGAVVVRVF